jgi:DNA-directed RNA polymerase specialized sigma24 family protein
MDSSAEDHFRSFVQAQSRPLLRLAFLLTGDRGHAEDLMQTALYKAYLHWRRVMRYDRPEAYVRKVMLNEQRKTWRRRGRAEDLTSRPPERGTPDGVVVVLRYWEDRSEADTAEILDCSVGTVKKLGSTGLARLRRQLGTNPDAQEVTR